MKKVMFLLIIGLISLGSCQQKSAKTENAAVAQTSVSQKAKIEVLYFHGTKRCMTCNAVESNTLKVLNEKFKAKVDAGEIVFKSLNFEEEANKSLVEKYEIGYSTLLILAKNEKTDLTENAFQYARTEPVKFAALLENALQKFFNK
jgi:hypothetical protein